MKWIPKTPIVSTLEPRFNPKDYKKDWKFDFIKGNILENEYVEGFENFIQRFISVLITNETPMIKYGLLELIPKSQNQNEFDNECNMLANAIVNHKYSNLEPSGLGYTVESIYSIERTKLNDIDYLIVETKITGLSDKLVIKAPLALVQEYLK